MVPTEAIKPEKQRRGAAAVKEGGRIIATTFLSLLLPLSFLLLARLSVARYFLSSDGVNDHETSLLRSVFLHCKTTLILSFIVDVVAIEALLQGFSGNTPAFVVCERRSICVAWVLIFLVQVCLILGIHGTVDAELMDIFTVGNAVSPRRIVFALGLHEIMLFWRRCVVAPVVDETMFGSTDKGFSWVEEVVLAAAFGNLWWRRLRDEADALVLLPWIRTELKMNWEVEVADAVGWLVYYLTAAIGGVRVIKGVLWVAVRIFRQRHWPKNKGVDAAVNSPV